MKLSAVARTKAIVKRYGFKFKKSLGQNFLVDEQTLDKITSAAELTLEDFVVEIGPGIGTLTECLAEKSGQVLAVEIDQQLLPILQETLGAWENIQVVQGDILKINLDQLVGEKSACKFGPTSAKYKVVANLPYYITTPIIMKLLEERYNLKSMVVMVQKEVAERFVSPPGSKVFGAISVAIQYYTKPEIVTLVPAGAFVPSPEVDSAVVKLTKLMEPAVRVASESLFFQVVKAAFAQRRKTLLNSLVNADFGLDKQSWVKLLTDLGIDTQRRGETLSLEEYAAITNQLVVVKSTLTKE